MRGSSTSSSVLGLRLPLDALAYVRHTDFAPSSVAFDAAFYRG